MAKPQLIVGLAFFGVFTAGAVSALVVERFVLRGGDWAVRVDDTERPSAGLPGVGPDLKSDGPAAGVPPDRPPGGVRGAPGGPGPGVGAGGGPGPGPNAGPGAGPGRPSFIAHRLGLTREQHEAMDRIWTATREQIGQIWAQRRALQQERDDAMRQLLTEEQRQRAEQLSAHYESRLAELRDATEALMREADRQTRALLTPEQIARYEELQRERMAREELGGRGRGGEGVERRPDRGPGGPGADRGPGGPGPGGRPPR